jgi:transposase InsO family protein
VADFTYLWTAEGWRYIAAVLDLFSQRVVGWSMQAAPLTLGQQVVPHASRAVGPVALQETRPDLGAQHLVATSTLAAWPRQPRIEPTPRDTERLA